MRELAVAIIKATSIARKAMAKEADVTEALRVANKTPTKRIRGPKSRRHRL
jgi:hypothetical protein